MGISGKIQSCLVLSLLLSHQISMNALRGGLVAVKSVIIHQDHMYVAVEEVLDWRPINERA